MKNVVIKGLAIYGAVKLVAIPCKKFGLMVLGKMMDNYLARNYSDENGNVDYARAKRCVNNGTDPLMKAFNDMRPFEKEEKAEEVSK